VVDEALGSGRPDTRARTSPPPEGTVRAAGSAAAPHGFSVRYAPADLAGQWHDVVTLDDGRVGVLVGCCTDPEIARGMRSAARSALLETADPVRSLDCVTGSSVSAVCAVIDDETIGYSGHGDANTAIATPDATSDATSYTQGPAVQHANGRLVVAPLAPGSTVLLCTGQIGQAAAVLDGCESMHPEQVADQVIDRLGSGIATVLYRHPPVPLTVTLAAHPAGLAVSRGRLRRWLAAAGVDAESSADILLAVGEATANATEHAVVGADHDVAITVTATITGSRLRLTVCDDGVWKPPPASSGHRGHGIPLINALVDSAELTTTPEGTTVEMVKELRP
jgi:anti-sigma regulatory factor (Ser/Thr protein kinase)